MSVLARSFSAEQVRLFQLSHGKIGAHAIDLQAKDYYKRRGDEEDEMSPPPLPEMYFELLAQGWISACVSNLFDIICMW